MYACLYFVIYIAPLLSLKIIFPVNMATGMDILFTYILGQYSSGFLIGRPTNTADVAGTINITFECASNYYSNVTVWYFTPLGSFSNQTALIAAGYNLIGPNQQQFALRVTSYSSVLVVRQLSNLTEGNYSCRDYTSDTASALLLVIRKHDCVLI